MRSILFSILTLACGTLSASFYAGGDALYWQMGSRSFDYALLSSQSVQTVCPDYSWGGRLYGGYVGDCLRYELGGLWVDGSNRARVRNGSITLPFGGFADLVQATGKLQTSYWNLDGRAGFLFHGDHCLTFELLAGVRVASVMQRREVTGLDGEGNEVWAKDRLGFCGAGPEVGVRADAMLICDIYLMSELDLVALIGDRKERFSRSTGSDVRFRNETVVVPAVDLRVGLGYGREWGCVGLAAEVGYQMNYFFQPHTALIEFAQPGSVPVTRHEQDLSFGGPFIGLKVGF